MNKINLSHLDFSISEIYPKIAADNFRVVAGIGKERMIFEDDELSDHFKVIAKIHDFMNFITSVEFEIEVAYILEKNLRLTWLRSGWLNTLINFLKCLAS